MCPRDRKHGNATEVNVSSSVKESQVIDIAFVFSAEFLEHVWVDYYCMSHVFFTRMEIHLPFSITVDERNPNRIWFSLI